MTQSKSILSYSFKLFIGLCILVLSNSCTKNEVPPSLEDSILGSYIGTTFRLGGTDVPLPLNTNGDLFEVRFDVTKGTAPATVDLNLVTIQTTKGVKKSSDDKLTGLIVEKGTGNEVLIKENNVTVATVKGKEITLSFDLEGQTGSFIGKRP